MKNKLLGKKMIVEEMLAKQNLVIINFMILTLI